jgi:hypothetical protein
LLSADGPFIAGAEKELPSPLRDPKAFDNTSTSRKISRKKQIATEPFTYSHKLNMSANNCAPATERKIRFLRGYLTL